MSSEKQIVANRKNAALSTGPTTAEGKQKVAVNAIKHGIFSTVVVLDGEDAHLFGELAAGLRTQFDPQGTYEEMLVDRIAAGMWRLRRVLRLESFMLTPDPLGLLFDKGIPEGAISEQFSHSLTKMADLAKYECGIERSITRAMIELRLLRERRDWHPGFAVK